MITSFKIKKYIRSANRVAKSINNSIAEDDLWRGRFIMRQKKFQFYQYDDKSGLHVDFWYEFEDLKTGQKKIYRKRHKTPFFRCGDIRRKFMFRSSNRQVYTV